MLSDQDPRLEAQFPNLRPGTYSITSDPTPFYNCIAWAMGDPDNVWDPDPTNGYFWPDSAPRIKSIESFTMAFASVGFKLCDGPEFESGYEKISLYTNDLNIPTHAARQLNEDTWTSKIGNDYDISHGYDALNSPIYGEPRYFYSRRIN